MLLSIMVDVVPSLSLVRHVLPFEPTTMYLWFFFAGCPPFGSYKQCCREPSCPISRGNVPSLWGTELGAELLGHRTRSCSAFLENVPKRSPGWLGHLCFPQQEKSVSIAPQCRHARCGQPSCFSPTD